jgi:hypothetical protein
VGGVITEAEAKELILQKHHELVSEQLDRYLNGEARNLCETFENFWEKYAVSGNELEQERTNILTDLRKSLNDLRYIDRSAK